MKKKPAKTQAQLKKELDHVFAEWVRKSDEQRCYTCGKRGGKFQAGHFISRSYLATRWDTDNVKNQCVGCNIFGNGRSLDFEEHLIRDLGKKRVEALKKKRHQITKISPAQYQELIDHYKSLL